MSPSVVPVHEYEKKVVAFPVETGQQVKKNDVIMRLDSRDAQLQVRVAETRVKEAENALQRAQPGAARTRIFRSFLLPGTDRLSVDHDETRGEFQSVASGDGETGTCFRAQDGGR